MAPRVRARVVWQAMSVLNGLQQISKKITLRCWRCCAATFPLASALQTRTGWFKRVGALMLVCQPSAPQFCVFCGGTVISTLPLRQVDGLNLIYLMHAKSQSQFPAVSQKGLVPVVGSGTGTFRWKKRRYRILGQLKHAKLLYQQRQARSAKPLLCQSHHSSFTSQKQSLTKFKDSLHRIGSAILGDSPWKFFWKWLQGRRDASLLPSLARFLWDPWVAVRVGEASHLGPAGSRATTKKREGRFQSDEDSGLAEALLAVLNQHQSKKQSNPEPPRKKGKGGKTPVKPISGSGLAQALMAMLESAVRNSWSECPRNSVRLFRNNPKRVNLPLPGEFPLHNLRSKNRRCHFPGVDCFLIPTAGNPRSLPLRPNRRARARGGKSANPSVTMGKGKARFAAKVLPREWTDTLVTTTIPRILNALLDGQPVPGNLIFSADPDVVEETRAIWNAYMSCKMTSLLPFWLPPIRLDQLFLFGGSWIGKNPFPIDTNVLFTKCRNLTALCRDLPKLFQCLKPKDPKCKLCGSLCLLTIGSMLLGSMLSTHLAPLLLSGLNCWAALSPLLPEVHGNSLAILKGTC